MHDFLYVGTAENLDAAAKLAWSAAEEYFGPDREPLLTYSKGVKARNASNGVPVHGYTTTFRFRSRPA